MKLSIITPAYNEEKNILPLYQRIMENITKIKYIDDYEILFINDGSSDKTIDEIKKLADLNKRVKFLSFSRNFGKEAAMFAGLSYCDGDYSIIMDSDLQHPAFLIETMIEEALKGYDQVIAKRNREGDDKKKTFLSKLYYMVVNKLIDVKLEDGVGDFRLLSKKAVNALVSMKEYNRFSKGLFSWIGFDCKTIEYENVTRENGETKWGFKSLLKYALDGIMSFNDKPLRISIYFGFTTVVVGLLYVIYSLIRVLVVGVETAGYFTLISAVLLMGGVQLIAIGILGEYIGKIYYESKKRPHFLINESNINLNQTRNYQNSFENYIENNIGSNFENNIRSNFRNYAENNFKNEEIREVGANDEFR